MTMIKDRNLRMIIVVMKLQAAQIHADAACFANCVPERLTVFGSEHHSGVAMPLSQPGLHSAGSEKIPTSMHPTNPPTPWEPQTSKASSNVELAYFLRSSVML